MFALLDGNNFYVSCERVFRSSLKGQPVIVLSNNDGCAIARSEEAKALGIKMGDPYFQLMKYEHTHGLVSLSANFALYGDMSDRMMSIASAMGPEIEPYSIDECFIGMHGVPDATRRARVISDRIRLGLGIPNCVGLGPTKTLAKLANHVAKSAERKPGSYPPHLARICNFAEMHKDVFSYVLKQTPVGDVWGIGSKLAKRLAWLNVCTALDLSRMPTSYARKQFGVVMERTVLELQGISCLELETEPPPKQQIACTRSFGEPVTELGPLLEAVSHFTQRAAEKLRKQTNRCAAVHVFAHTSPFSPFERFAKSATIQLTQPSSDTKVLLAAAEKGVRQIYEAGHRLSKAGVMLMDLSPCELVQNSLLDPDQEEGRDMSALMETVDTINARFGMGSLCSGSALAKGQWQMRQQRKSPYYTTQLADLPRAR